MSDAAAKRVEEIFCDCLKVPDAAARAQFLDRACAGDSALRAAVEAMMAQAPVVDRFFEDSRPTLNRDAEVVRLLANDFPGATAEENNPAERAACENPAGPADEITGTRIGAYKLLQKIGEGGCGVVYMAEQEKPVRRRVALKVIKLGMDTKNVIARFEAERQALALMDHPNIARVLDAGTTETGRPYFVMELVRGVKLTTYCDENHLDARQRLELFVQVCQAIQHAHQKGVIHRDIKPSNILVTLHDGVPVPKVIDFGIAKAIEGRLTDSTVFTAYEQFIGTPAYMSPEQAEMSGLDVDTRSDIYSLGVLLYELLTGRTPFDQKSLINSGLDGMRRTLREQIVRLLQFA
ncbi:MAG TPA: serine/threonine-protein kinase, partial [Verrucomicrobiae bacterium]